MDQELSIIISRVIGNELTPREIPGSKIKVLERLLHKPQLMDAFWVVNRVYNKLLYKEYINLLESYNQSYTVIPFVLKEYRQLLCFAEKVHYGTNVNNARNVGIGMCREKYKFVIAADGDCYFPGDTANDIKRQIVEDQKIHPARQYYSIPGKRLYYHDKEESLRNTKTEEHLLVLRQDAPFIFNEKTVFGQGDARELFQRIGYKTEKNTCMLINDTSKVLNGFMASISCSKDRKAEAELLIRMDLRNKSLVNLVKEMDAQTVGFL